VLQRAEDVSRVWRGVAAVPPMSGSVVAIGVFDGVHRGHRVLLDRARAAADERGLPLVAVTFDPHPMSVVRPGWEPLLLCSLDHRIDLLLDAGADRVLVVDFTPEFAALTPEEFVEQVLVGPLSARHIVVGDNFRFGRRASGDAQTLAELGGALGFGVDDVPLAAQASEPWSSTYVRGLIAGGDVRAAAEALGRPFRLEGPVVHGDHRGRELGYPTANLDVGRDTALPADGVYAARLVVAGRTHPAALSVGTNPQFAGREVRVEAYAITDEDLDLYGEWAAVDLIDRIRGQAVFGSVAELTERMSRDVAEARRILSGTVGD